MERFLSKVEPVPESGCWLWMDYLDRDGYGQFRVSAKTVKRAHRMSYELHVGPIPDGMTLDHKCRVRCCVNPKHLEPVPNRVNISRGLTGKVNHRNARKQLCPRGHEYDYVHPVTGWRACTTCIRENRHRREAHAPS